MSEGGRGATEAPWSGALAALEALAVPDERSGGGVPARDRVVEPGDQVVLGLGLLSVEGAADDDPLDGLGHVQPGAADRRVERHHAVVFGLVLLTPNALALLALVILIVAVEIQVKVVEEPHLERAHGDAYRGYRARTWRFVPGLGR